MGRIRKEQPLVSDNPAKFANDLNRFYARYDNIDYRDECDILCHTISSTPVTLVESDVASHVLTQTKHLSPMVCGAVLRKYAWIGSVLFSQEFSNCS